MSRARTRRCCRSIRHHAASNAIQRVREIGAEIDPSMQRRRVVTLSCSTTRRGPAFQRSRWPSDSSRAPSSCSRPPRPRDDVIHIAQRTREIGIRSALGAHPRHLLFGIFGERCGQLALGIAAVLCCRWAPLLRWGAPSRPQVGARDRCRLMAMVASLAAIGPARRSADPDCGGAKGRGVGKAAGVRSSGSTAAFAPSSRITGGY